MTRSLTSAMCPNSGPMKTAPPQCLRRPHVVFWLQRDLQDFGVAHNLLIAGGGDSFACDPVYLVEGVWFQDPLVSRPNKNLQPQWLVFHVAMELRGEKTESNEVVPICARGMYLQRQGVSSRESKQLQPCCLPKDGGRGH